LIEPAEAGEYEAGQLLDEYSPDFWLSGHVHDLPYELRGKWCHKLGTTIVLTPGQILEASWPNHIELDTESGKIEWRSIRKMPEPSRLVFEIRDLRILPSLFQALLFSSRVIVAWMVNAPPNDRAGAVVRNRNRSMNGCPMCRHSTSPG
jgi:hypothetical protein